MILNSLPDDKEEIGALVLKTIEQAETMALSTIDNDERIKKVLFKLGTAYSNFIRFNRLDRKEILKTINEFYNIDPEFLEMINARTKTP